VGAAGQSVLSVARYYDRSISSGGQRRERMKRLWILLVAVAVVVGVLAAGVATGSSDARAKLSTGLSGSEEVPPADPDGTGTAKVKLYTKGGKVCWNIKVQDIQTATLAHIHKAPMGMNGPVVVDMSPAPGDADDGAWKACRRGVDKALIRDIIANPTQYYVNVHNMQFPGGAIRGQLGD
jgi:hypothetical protein